MTVEEYLLPETLDQAVQLLARYEDSLLVLAGGTVAMPLINEGVSTPERVMGLNRIGLDYVKKEDGRVVIGATTKLSTLLELRSIPMLRKAVKSTGAWITRNLGTVGGNLFVPPPAGDVAVALLALDAEVRLVNGAGERTVHLDEFFTGFMTNVLEPDELLVEIIVPYPSGATAFNKLGRKRANTPAVVTVAAHLISRDGQIAAARIALGAVGPHPIRAVKAEEVLTRSTLSPEAIRTAAAAAAEECKPFTDAVASERYRRKMVSVYVERVLKEIAEEEEMV